MARRFATSTSEQSGEVLDFSPESLRVLDGILAEWLDLDETHRDDQAGDVMPAALPVAAYVGEVFIQAMTASGIPATWVTESESDQMSAPHVLIGDAMRVNVVKRAIETLSGLDRPAFHGLYETVASIATTDSDRQEPNG